MNIFLMYLLFFWFGFWSEKNNPMLSGSADLMENAADLWWRFRIFPEFNQNFQSSVIWKNTQTLGWCQGSKKHWRFFRFSVRRFRPGPGPGSGLDPALGLDPKPDPDPELRGSRTLRSQMSQKRSCGSPDCERGLRGSAEAPELSRSFQERFQERLQYFQTSVQFIVCLVVSVWDSEDSLKVRLYEWGRRAAPLSGWKYNCSKRSSGWSNEE